MIKYKKTRVMNIIGAVGWALVGVALFFNKMGEQSAGILITIVLMYALLVAVPTVTARALSANSSRQRRTAMIWANWFLIGLWCFSLIGSLFMHVGLAQVIPGILAFVIPEAINIRALRTLNRQASLPDPTQNLPLTSAGTGGSL